MSEERHARARDVRLFAISAGVLLFALALAALLARPHWSKAPETTHRFLGLDEPVEASRPGR